MPKAGLNPNLPCVDNLFSTEESRVEDKLNKIRDIPILDIDDFPGYPFKVNIDEDMEQLVESIKQHGIITPAKVGRNTKYVRRLMQPLTKMAALIITM